MSVIVDRILGLCAGRNTTLVGIDGRGGAGKSTLARQVAAAIDTATVVQFDDFYLPSAERGRTDEIGAHFDWRRVRAQVLEPLSAGVPTRYQRYDWVRDELAEWHELTPGGIVIVEGNYSTRPELRELYHLTVWVEAPHELRLHRGVERDGESARSRWLNEWMPEEDRYLAAVDPASHADLVVAGF